MPSYPVYGPEHELERCECGLFEAYHRPDEAYYNEFKLEGKRSSSTALRWRGCTEYRPERVTFGEVFSEWLRRKRGE